MTWWSRENIFLPPEYLQDLKTADEASLSFMRNISDVSDRHGYQLPLCRLLSTREENNRPTDTLDPPIQNHTIGLQFALQRWGSL